MTAPSGPTLRNSLLATINQTYGLSLAIADISFGTPVLLDPLILDLIDPVLRNTEVQFSVGAEVIGASIDAKVTYNRLSLPTFFNTHSLEFSDEDELTTHAMLGKIGSRFNITLDAEDFEDLAITDNGDGTRQVILRATTNSYVYFGEVFPVVVVSNVVPVTDWTQPLTDFATQDFESGIVFNGSWYLDSTWAYEGTQSLRAGAITHDGVSTTTIEVQDGTGRTIGFQYRISSEADYDFLKLFINNVEMWSISGESTGYVEFPLDAGFQTIEWRYVKDESVSEGLDTAFIDNVNLFATPAPDVVLPMERGILVSHPGGTLATTEFDKNRVLTDGDAPALANSGWAVFKSNTSREIYSINGFSASLEIRYSGDGARDWKAQLFTTHKLASNQAVFFQSKFYFAAQDRSDSTYGIYRLDRTGQGETATFAIVKVFALSGINAAFAASANHLAVYDGFGNLHRTIDGVNFTTDIMYHPNAGIANKLFRAVIAFVGDTLVGIGIDGTFSTPSVLSFVGVPGSSYTWKTVDPWGDERSWNYTEGRMANVDGSLILALSGPTGNTAKILRSPNLGDVWSIVADDTGIYPMSVVDDGVRVMITGFREVVGPQYHWMAYSMDRGLTWIFDEEVGSFYEVNKSDYTFATEVKPRPFTSGFVVSNTLGTVQADDPLNYLSVAAPAPASDQTFFATMATDGVDEIVECDGTNADLTLSSSIDRGTTFKTQHIPDLRLISNGSVFFQGSCYILALKLTGNEFGIYKLVRTGVGADRVYTPVRVYVLSAYGGSIAVNAADTQMAYYDTNARLSYTTDGTNWLEQVGVQYPAASGPLNEAVIGFLGNDVVGLGRSGTAGHPYVVMFRGPAGGSYTWTGVEPHGAGTTWPFSEMRMMVVDDLDLIVAVNASSSVYKACILLRDGTTGVWSKVKGETGIDPMTLSDSGTHLMLTGKREDAGVNGHWMTFSPDRGRNWRYDVVGTSHYGLRQTSYSYAVGIKPAV